MTGPRGGRRRDAVRARLGVTVLSVAGVLLVAAALPRFLHDPAWREARVGIPLAAFALAVFIGELLPIEVDGVESTPISSAAGLGLALSAQMPIAWRAHGVSDTGELHHGAATVIVIVALAPLLAHLVRLAMGTRSSASVHVAKFWAVAAAAVAWRQFDGVVDHTALRLSDPEPWLRAINMLTVATFSFAVYVLVLWAVTRSRRPGLWTLGTTRAVAPTSAALPATIATTGCLLALGMPALGVAAIPLFLLPLGFAFAAMRRYARERATVRQTAIALSRVTGTGGYTTPGHGERVAALAVAVGQELGLSDNRLGVLEQAALLHDVGQLALSEPIPNGATVMAAPADQERIAAWTIRILSEAGFLQPVEGVLGTLTVPYRHVLERTVQVPVESRILKVVNAFDDFCGGSTDEPAARRALERLHLGMGYDYDPRAVLALEHLLVTTGIATTGSATGPASTDHPWL